MAGMRGLTLTVFAVAMLLSAVPAFAQEDALREMTDLQFVDYLRQYRDPATLTVVPGLEGRVQNGKCGFAVISEAAHRLETAGPAVAADIRALLAPQARQTSILSPSGRFRIYYDTSGIDAAAMLAGDTLRIPNSAHDYAQAVAAVFDSVYQIEVLDYGFDAPPFEETLSAYNIFVMDFRGSLYGQTLFNLPLPSSGTVRPTYASHMEIDNDFLGYETRGLDGLRVTAAHEFHHMVQLGTYGLWLSDRWMHEMSSTYFEEAVYPHINDYFQYIRAFMRNTDRAMWLWGADGYELALWPLFLEHKYDPTLIRDFWVGMRQVEPMTAMRDGIQQRGGDMGADLCSWAQANFFTGYRAYAMTPQAYDDAPALARAQLHASQSLAANEATISGTLAPTGAMYMRVYRGIDTVSFVVENSNVANAIQRTATGVDFELEVMAAGWDNSYTPLDNGWAYRFTAGEVNSLCLSVLEGGASSEVERDIPFPNPFNPNEFSRMQFPLPRNIAANRADLFIFSPSMNLVARKEGQTIELDDNFGAFVGYDGRTDGGDLLPSGVYFYVIKYGDESKTGKFAVVKR
ncbi:MAG: hypothetical protein IH600_03615 [Bacteroidetes bacterium]|nr:hypothetical protein [Bacteroidota bacterium]